MGNLEPPVFGEDTVPKDALRATLEWLEAVVPDCQAVRSSGRVRRVRGPIRTEVWLQSLTYSRRGAGAWVNLSMGRGAQLFGPLEGYLDLPGLRDRIEHEWLPTLDLFDSTARLAEEFDVSHTSTFNVIEWLVFRDDVASARRLLERYLDGHPSVRPLLEQGRAAGMPQPGTPIRNEITERWAPTLESLGVLAPGEPLPGLPPAEMPEVVDAAAELRGLLGRFGRVTEV